MRSMPLVIADIGFLAAVVSVMVIRARQRGRRNSEGLVAGTIPRQVVWGRMLLGEAILLAVTLAYLLIARWDPREIGLQWPDEHHLIVGSLTLFVCIVGRGAQQAKLQARVGRDVNWNNPADGRAVAARLAPQSRVEWRWWLFVSLVTATAEELFFRGLMFNAIQGVAPVWTAVTVSALCFGLVHAHYTITQSLGLAVTGAAFAGLYILGGGLLFPVVAHALLNMSAVSYMKRIRQTPAAR